MAYLAQISFDKKFMSRQQTKEDRFAKLRDLRKKRETNLQHYKVEDDSAIYDMVTEEEFNKIAKRVILEDDFVVDDNGEGVDPLT